MRGRADPQAGSRRVATDFPPEEARRYLDRVLASDTFCQSPRLSAFLEYIVDRALAGRSDEISECAIAMDVFQRDASPSDSRIDSIVRVSALQLRKKLARYYQAEGSSDRLKIRVPTPGYVPTFEVQAETGRSTGFPRFRTILTAGILVALAGVAGLVSWQASRKNPEHSGKPVVAILPLRTLSPDPADRLFSEALTEEITTQLGRFRAVSVISHRASLSFGDSGSDPAASEEPLNLDFFLEGAVARTGKRLWMTARLTTADRQQLVWGESFERTLDEHLAVRKELSRAIAGAVGAKLGDGEASLGRAPGRAVPHSYILAKAHMQQWNPGSLRRSAEYFAEAIEANPDFAPAYAGYAMALRVLSFIWLRDWKKNR